MKLTQTTCNELARAVREAVPTTHALYLDFGGCVIRTDSSTDALHNALADYFKEFACAPADPAISITVHEVPEVEFGLDFLVKQPDPGKSKIKEEWADLADGRVVRKRLTGMHFVFGGGENAAVGPCLENSNQVINFINNRFIEWKLNRGGLLGHASGVLHNGRGLSLAGFSGAGKSTLALHLMSRGTTFVSNDRVMILPEGDGVAMYGVAKQPRINPGTALNNPDLTGVVEPELTERFLSLPQDELWQLEHKYDALIDECYGPGRFVLKSPMDALVILNWKRGGGAMRAALADPRERFDLLSAFMKGTGLFYLPEDPARRDDPGADAYADMLSRADLIEISGGVDFERAADVCLGYMATGHLPEA